MKKVLGLDLGTTSIGWALVNEATEPLEKSSIIKLGVRVNPLSVDELSNFERGKSITTNAERTLKRSMRRNLQRYKLRRENLIEILRKHNIISDDTLLSENGSFSTHETYRLRATAVTDKISLEEFARILLMINKKRGYKSNRKAKGQEDGQLIDGMEIARRLYNDNLTPGQLSLQLLQEGKKKLPDYYRSDLHNEFERIWAFQKTYYPEILTDDLRVLLSNKADRATWAILEKPFGLVGIKRTGNKEEQNLENYEWRSMAICEKLDPEELAIVFQKINGQINQSSGYLGNLSDRSKELYFKKQTVGQNLYLLLNTKSGVSLKNRVFYRQDYLDEFNIIWESQARFHKKLTNELKHDIRDVIIFHQRPLRSQKGLISYCEFESKTIQIDRDGQEKTVTIGSRVIPRSSPLFQEFRIWQNLNNIEVFVKGQGSRRTSSVKDVSGQITRNERRLLSQEEKELLFQELTIREEMRKSDALKLLFGNYNDLDMNFQKIEGNRTVAILFRVFNDIIELTGHERMDSVKKSAFDNVNSVISIFKILRYNTEILHFDSEKELDSQPLFKLWHLLYSYEGDNSKTGNESLITKISDITGVEREYAELISNIVFEDDFGNLSSKAIRKLMPYLKAGNRYDLACEYAGYRHSRSSLTREEIDAKVLKDKLEILPRNSLRNPVVEKILNQMVNLINKIIDVYGKPDEIRIELARELKKNAAEREELSKAISESSKIHEEIRKTLLDEYGLKYVSRNDIIRYKLYQELATNSYKTLYSNTYIPREKLFSKEFDIEHIIPQARLFDDSYSNKTLEARDINIEKGDRTAFDFIKDKYGEAEVQEYLLKIDTLYKDKVLSRAKYNKLRMTQEDIPDGFIDRDLRNTQYIAKKALEMLHEIVRNVVPTTGSITERLREDWQLVDAMKELNWEKYKALGLVEYYQDRDGRQIGRINDWSKRDDHRHHAMDALTVAFTKRVYVQYFNNINARYDKSSNAYAIEQKYFSDRKVIAPMPLSEFRAEARKHLEDILVSIKAKNKVVTNNVNITKKQTGVNKLIQPTPRGQLHLENIYGKRMQPITKEIKVGGTLDQETIQRVTNPCFRKALIERLNANNGDPKNAFTGRNSLEKNPIFIDPGKTKELPSKVKILSLETIYTIRKEITPDLNVDKVVDHKIRQILRRRIEEFGDAQKAFSDIEKNPIWLNESKGIAIKRVAITGIANAQALREKRDKEGSVILDAEGRRTPVDYVNTGNNHHVAIYRDQKGELHDCIVSFYEAVARANAGLPVIDKNYNRSDGWEFLFSMKQNEYFVFPNEETGFNPSEVDLYSEENYSIISPNLFRVQKFSHRNFVFRHHLETNVNMDYSMKEVTWTDFRSLKGIDKIIKVRIDHIGRIVAIGEY